MAAACLAGRFAAGVRCFVSRFFRDAGSGSGSGSCQKLWVVLGVCTAGCCAGCAFSCSRPRSARISSTEPGAAGVFCPCFSASRISSTELEFL